MSQVSLTEVQSFFEMEVWKVMEDRINTMLTAVDAEIETADPFRHGVAVGERQALRLILKMSDILSNEASGKSPYGNG